MNPLIDAYNSLQDQQEVISRIHFVADFAKRFHPIAVVFYYDDGNQSKEVDVSNASDTVFRQYESELRIRWRRDHGML